MKLDQAVKYFKSQRKIAKILGISEGAVSKWTEENIIPVKRAIKLNELSNGELSVNFDDYRRE